MQAGVANAGESTQACILLNLGAHDKSCTSMKQSNTVRIDQKINNLQRSVNIRLKVTQKPLHDTVYLI
jgi:hypothetical protein